MFFGGLFGGLFDFLFDHDHDHNPGRNGRTIIGTRFGEYLYGTDRDDFIDGRGGNDTIKGFGGNDTIFGGTGNDKIYGGDGNDTINGEEGNDYIEGGRGDDVVFGAAGRDTIWGNDGIDTLDGGDDDDFVSGGDGDDQIYGGGGNDVLFGDDGNDTIYAGPGNDQVYAGKGDDTVTGEDGNDHIEGNDGNDTLEGGAGNDEITGGAGDDTAKFNVSTDGADKTDLGTGSDVVLVDANAATQVRLTFTSAEVGNDNPNDSGLLANQDGGLAVRLQAEDGSDGLTGPVSRFDDEGITFVAGTGVTFDVRDLVSGAQRGDKFEVVVLGTKGDDTLSAAQPSRPYYFNGGQGNDTITGGDANDFLVGGAGDDKLDGGKGDDKYIGGGGNDTITDTGGGVDTIVAFNVTTDGADSVDLGGEQDIFNVSATAPTNVRLTFTSADVGNSNALDGNNAANEDGGLAVRLQAEDGTGTPAGNLTRVEDEGITFVGGAGVTFDVRDLPSGAQRGEAFEVVVLGTSGDDILTAAQPARPYYINGGGGSDVIIGGDASDFLVGGTGNDFLNGGAGKDTILGGAGNDTIDSIDRPSNIFAGVIPPESDVVDAGAGDDNVTGGRTDKLTGGDGTDFLLLNFGFDGPNLNPAAVTLTLDATGTGTANDGTFITGFEQVSLFLTDNADTVDTGNVTASLVGGRGDDKLTTGTGNDQVFGGDGNDTISTGDGNDTIAGNGGNDDIKGGAGDDQLSVDPANDGADTVDLGEGYDTVSFTGFAPTQIRLTFTSADVGNGNALDGNNAANEDGGLAVRLQQEDASGNLIGSVSRYDDEGITFLEGTQGYTFDVRDLPTGTQRGDQFKGVVLGTAGDDSLTFFPPFRSGQEFYYNAGLGNDTVTAGSANDFLVGGGGNDKLFGNGGDDKYIGGGGSDTITDTGGGVDTIVAFNILTDGPDTVDLGGELDVFNVGTTAGSTTNVRVTFTSADIGNGNALDGNNAVNEDGGLAVRLQAEDALGVPTGPVTRAEDEGLILAGGTGVTFDVRDLPSGVGRGEAFEVVVLGTSAADTLTAVQNTRPYYFNGGMGDDTITGGTANDFLVGGAGLDTLKGGAGNDSYIGGAGNDTITDTGGGNDTAFFDVVTGGADTVNLGTGNDSVNVSGAGISQVRISLTERDIGNGNVLDGNNSAGEDGGLSVHLQAEDAGGNLTGLESRFDDEGVTFVAAAGITFEVRDYATDRSRGDGFTTVTLGSSSGDTVTGTAGADYISVGLGDDVINPGDGADFVNGDGGNDTLMGDGGADTLRGGAGDDIVRGGNGNDFITGDTGFDQLIGDAGDDIIFGGAGRDRLTGGTGNDQFRFTSVTDSGVTGPTRDFITDFLQGADTIQLSSIDANTSLANDQAFTFTGTAAFSGTAGELHYLVTGGNTFVEADVNGDATADFSVRLNGVYALNASDFIL